MKLIGLVKYLLIGSLFWQNICLAKNSAHIFSINSTQSTVEFSQNKDTHGYYTYTSFAVGYAYAFRTGFQMGGSFKLRTGEGLEFTGGFAYNFKNQDLENSRFIAVNMGVLSDSVNSKTYDDAFVSFEVGTRIRLVESLSYVPKIVLHQLVTPGSPGPSLIFSLINFSYLL